MIINMDGGMSLNYSVTAYADEASLQADTPGLNTIGVITSVPFSRWSFSQEKPAGQKDGTLWFKTGDPLYSDAAFSAVLGNPVMVYPLSAYQYQSGEWKEISARTFQEKDGVSQWVTWIRQTVYLVRDGVLQVDFELDDAGNMTITQGEEDVTFQAGAAAGYAMIPLDLTHYKTLEIEGTDFAIHTSERVGAWELDVTPAYNNAAASTVFANKSGKTTLDVSELTGVHNVGMILLAGVNYKAVVTNFYLTRS